MIDLRHGDCLEVMRTMADSSVDAVVTDPPYGLSFMGKRWDYDVPSTEIWAECLRVLKPGGHLLAFAGTRTQHRMAVRIEDAGFEIRDMIAWVYGSGFPKSLDVSKAIDKAAGHARGSDYEPNFKNGTFGKGMGGGKHGAASDPPATEAARQWQGWGTALKPALEPITMARKPLEGTVAANVTEHGTGGLNIDGCRVETMEGDEVREFDRAPGNVSRENWRKGTTVGPPRIVDRGRWPANLIHDGSAEVLDLFPVSSVTGKRSAESQGRFDASSPLPGSGKSNRKDTEYTDSGSAARFFYCPKASKRDRDEGLDAMPDVLREARYGSVQDARPHTPEGYEYHRDPRKNNHPTVKPTDLMRYLCRLVTPPGGVVLDPFMGSGSTGKAARLEGFRFIGIERDADYFAIAQARAAA